MKLGVQVGLGPGQFVFDGDAASPPKGAHPPNFRPMSVVAKMAARIKMLLGMEVGLGPGDFAIWEPSSRTPKGGHSSQLSAHAIVNSTPGACLETPNIGLILPLDREITAHVFSKSQADAQFAVYDRPTIRKCIINVRSEAGG